MEQQGEQSYTVTCISCGKETLNVKDVYYNIPKFGIMVISSMLCSNCGYRVFDTTSLDTQGPARIEFKVNKSKDLYAKVIRSSTSSIRIPELGLELTPGSRAEAFVTDVEGVLDRFLEITEQLINSADIKPIDNAIAVRERIKLAMEGKVPFTIVIEDEAGNSAIVPENETSGDTAVY